MRLTKSRDNVVMSGVLGGLGEYYNIDPTLLRIGFVVLVFLNVFPLIPLYIVAALIIPEAPKDDKDRPRRHQERPHQRERTKREAYRERQRRSRERSDERNRRRDEFEPRNDFDDYSASKVNKIDEDDWSDF